MENKGECYVLYYFDILNELFYLFGYGKSYSEFELKISSFLKELNLGELLYVEVIIKNISDIVGKEVI